jgi:8-oxo-dGTP pyrophosphatase MutT (NUDIX family)
MYEIPDHRLPPGFLETLERPPDPPVPARPAATAVLLRDAAPGPEVLLLRRNRSAGFVPGAWVFPGGRVDDDDDDPALLAHATGAGAPPGAAHRFAAVREVLEETGLLLGADSPPADVPAWRHALMAGETTLRALLAGAGIRLDLARLVHCAHWITPVVEPRRYDTHFFLAAVRAGAQAAADPRETTGLAWLTPAAALDRFADGALPMVFPTVRTLESLAGHATADAALAAFRGRPVPPILPRLVRTAGGVGLTVDDD